MRNQNLRLKSQVSETRELSVTAHLSPTGVRRFHVGTVEAGVLRSVVIDERQARVLCEFMDEWAKG